MKRPRPNPAQQRLKAQESLKRKALRVIKRARAAADLSEVDLTEWEGEFLGSIEGRVNRYGRAFADPEKGASGSVFSIRQMRKIKEIAAKAKGAESEAALSEPPPRRATRRPFTRSG